MSVTKGQVERFLGTITITNTDTMNEVERIAGINAYPYVNQEEMEQEVLNNLGDYLNDSSGV